MKVKELPLFLKLVAVSLFILLLIINAEANANNFNSDSLRQFTIAGDFIGAKNYLSSFQESFEKSSDSIKVEFLIELGKTSISASQKGEGFNNLTKALEIAEKSEKKFLIDKTKIQLIEFYRDIREYKNALVIIKQMQQSLPKDHLLLCRFYHRSSAVYSELFNAKNGTVPTYLDTAILYSKKSLEISKKYNLLDQQYTSYRELSGIYSSTSVYHSSSLSKFYLDSALGTLNDQKSHGYYSLMKNKSHVFLNTKEYDSSIFYANKALPYFESSNNHGQLMELYWLKSTSYFSLNDSLNGLINMVKEAQADVKYRESQTQNKLTELTTAYNVELKDKLISEKEIELIKAKSEKQIYLYIGALFFVITLVIIYYTYKTNKKNKLLANLIKENNFLIGESNHRIKNNLQLIISLIGRKIFKSKKSNPELLEIADKIKSIAALHQHLYINDSKEKIAIGNYLKSIQNIMKSSLIDDGIQLNIEIKEFEIDIEKAVYLGLLVTELITNSLKYAFLNKSEKLISITLYQSNDRVYFHYKDSGVGLQQGKMPALVEVLTKQLKAEIHNVSDLGYQLKLVFKK